VAGRHQALDLDAFDGGAAHELRAGDQDVVLGMESDEGGHCGLDPQSISRFEIAPDPCSGDGCRVDPGMTKNIFGNHSTRPGST
jgi:hypothetical protein